jgi:nicotinate-nucleotide adenylyltransferase
VASATTPAARRTGVLGGTFDPPHLAHLALAAAAKHQLRLDRVLFLPAGDPWRKRDRRAITPAALRLRLVEAAIEGLSWAEVSDLELHRAGPTYTAETFEALSAADGAWWFILGEDALDDMPHWHEPARIVHHARLAVARRGDVGVVRVSEALRVAVPGVEASIDVVPLPPLALSSSDLRDRVRAGAPTGLLLPERVRALIDELGLYRDAASGGR